VSAGLAAGEGFTVPHISRATAGAVGGLAIGVALAAAVVTSPAAAHGASRRPAAAISHTMITKVPGRPRPLILRDHGAAGIRPADRSVDSLNSAGYAASRARTRFRLVRATFFVPFLNCRLSRGAFSADWVGLGGFVGSSRSVQQAGIEADCSAAGRSRYFAWYAMYPRKRATSRIRIKGGDSVTASIYFDAAHRKFALSVTDNTTGGHFLVRRRCPRGQTCPARSAEVISSAPASGTGSHLKIKPLADYGAVSFGAIAVTDLSGQRASLRSAHWDAARILQTQQDSPFLLIARPTQIHADTFATYWSRAK
jgi:hypothetical protein